MTLVTNKRNPSSLRKCPNIYLLDRDGGPGPFSAPGNVILAVTQVFVSFLVIFYFCTFLFQQGLIKGGLLVV